MQFGGALPRILQAIWEACPVQYHIWVSKLDFIDEYHCSTLRTSQVGAFTYVVPSAPGDEGCIICIDLFLSMGWVDLPQFLCAL